ncbi:MAG: zf-HC2 domain-containing protein [Prevotellaceae bacterium]|nr:zf-HC2 domain-containing protein [Prevotellaceae bacterium]
MINHSNHPEREQIRDYLMNRMNDEQEAVFQAHLLSCPDCRAQLDAIRRLAEALEPEQQARKTHRIMWRTLMAAAIAVLLASGTLLYLRYRAPAGMPLPEITAGAPDSAPSPPDQIPPAKPPEPLHADHLPAQEIKQETPEPDLKPSGDTLPPETDNHSPAHTLSPTMSAPPPRYATGDSIRN